MDKGFGPLFVFLFISCYLFSSARGREPNKASKVRLDRVHDRKLGAHAQTDSSDSTFQTVKSEQEPAPPC